MIRWLLHALAIGCRECPMCRGIGIEYYEVIRSGGASMQPGRCGRCRGFGCETHR